MSSELHWGIRSPTLWLIFQAGTCGYKQWRVIRLIIAQYTELVVVAIMPLRYALLDVTCR